MQKHADRCVVRYAAQDYSPSDLDPIYDQPYARMHLGKNAYSPALRMNLFSVTSPEDVEADVFLFH